MFKKITFIIAGLICFASTDSLAMFKNYNFRNFRPAGFAQFSSMRANIGDAYRSVIQKAPRVSFATSKQEQMGLPQIQKIAQNPALPNECQDLYKQWHMNDLKINMVVHMLKSDIKWPIYSLLTVPLGMYAMANGATFDQVAPLFAIPRRIVADYAYAACVEVADLFKDRQNQKAIEKKIKQILESQKQEQGKIPEDVQ